MSYNPKHFYFNLCKEVSYPWRPSVTNLYSGPVEVILVEGASR